MLFGQLHSSLFALHSLFVFIGALTDEDVIKALLGGSASFKFKVTTGMKVTLAVWKKCPDQKVFVFSPIHGLKIFDNNYADRLSIKSNHSILLDKLQESDFVTYCYELTTFPNGSLQGQNKLEKTTENGENIYFIRHLPQHNTKHSVVIADILYLYRNKNILF